MTLEYNESQLIRRLSHLTPRQRSAFAALVAERLVAASSGLVAPDGRGVEWVLIEALNGVWHKLLSEYSSHWVEQEIDSCTRLLAVDAEPSNEAETFSEDAVSAVIYTLRSLRHGSEQEAAWAARRGYEAVDRYVMNSEGLSIGDPVAEQQILTSPQVQFELQRQLEDLEELESLGPKVSAASYERLRAKARANANTFLRS